MKKEKSMFFKRLREERGEIGPISYELSDKVKKQIKILFIERTFKNSDKYTEHIIKNHPIEKISFDVVSKLRQELGEENIGDGLFRKDSILHYAYSLSFLNFFMENARDIALNDDTLKDKKNTGIEYEWTALEELCVAVLAFKATNLNYSFENHPDDFIHEVNRFLREASVGYKFSIEKKMFIKTSNMEAYELVTKPVLEILSKQTKYKVANEAFEKALEAYKKNEHDVALTYLGTTIEAVFREITGNNNSKDNIQDLINEFIKKNEKLKSHQSVLSALPKFLESVNAIRNRSGSAHPKKEEPTDNLTSFALHMTASILIFLIKSSEKSAEL